MSANSGSTENLRRYEGPAWLHQSWRDEKSIRERFRVVHSFEDLLTEAFGAEGIGWGFDPDDPCYAEVNEMNQIEHEAECNIANEAFHNLLYKGRYETDDGVSATGIVRYAAKPLVGNVVIYPDGDHYATENETLVRPHIRRAFNLTA